ncbi:MAG: FmdB family zinc ribbon protein [Bacillota bacterium]
MDIEFRCRTCNNTFFIALEDEGETKCPECSGFDLEWMRVDLSNWGCA